MNMARLSLAQTPPLTVPAPYLLAAPWFATAAGLWLALAPEDFTSRWSPAVLGITHLFTLGFLGLAMLGAFQQLLPVLLGAPLRHPRALALSVFLALAGGTALLAAGLGTGVHGLLYGALGLLGAAFTVFLFFGARALMRAANVPGTTGAMAAALAALAVTAGLGLHLAAGHIGGGLARGLTDVHAAWGLAGWIGLLVAGVAYQVVPMFQITPDYPRWLIRALGPALFATLVLWSLARVALPWAEPIARWLPALALTVFALATLRLQQRRRRRLPDVTVAYWRLGMVSLLAAVLLWLALPWLAVPTRLIGVLFLAGFGMSVVSGMMYKIVPFLVWLHLNNRLLEQPARRGQIPPMKRIIEERAARWQFRAHSLALALACAASLWPDAVRPAGLVLAVASALLGINLAAAVALYRRMSTVPLPEPAPSSR